MYILFSPSEGKKEGGNFPPLASKNLLFPQLYTHRLPLLQAYNSLINENDIPTLQTLTGIKKVQDIKLYQKDLFSTPTMPALERYAGVAYDYLKLSTLTDKEKNYLFKHTLIFSNLFGSLLGGDLIPEYKMKQGAKLGEIKTETIYKKEFSSALDDLFKDELILDLRAGFYEKFYTLNQDFITMKFLKGGKSVSHWAKAYRGKVLQTLAKLQPKTKEELLAIDYEGLKFIESLPYKKQGTMLVYEVL